MCEFCHQLSDTKESLENGPCPKRLDFTKENGKVETCETPLPPAKTPLPVVKTPSQHASKITFEMEKANKEIKRLQLLKAMAVERDRLAALIERKNKSRFLFAKIDIPCSFCSCFKCSWQFTHGQCAKHQVPLPPVMMHDFQITCHIHPCQSNQND